MWDGRAVNYWVLIFRVFFVWSCICDSRIYFLSFIFLTIHHETTGQLKMPHHPSHFMDLSQRCVFIKWPLRPIGHFFLQQLLKLNEVDKFIYTDLHSHYTCVIKVLIVLTIQRPIWKKFLESNAKQINWQCLIYFSLI